MDKITISKKDKIDITSLELPELERFFENIEEKKFRAKQVYEWLHQKLVTSFDEMTNLSKSLRERLESLCFIPQIEIIDKRESNIDGTVKYLFALSNDTIIESVLMRYEHGNAVCISTQAGCRMGCKFCASTVNGLDRNLLVGELLAQVYEIQKDCGERVSHIVLMGSGEPLENFDNVVKFINIINSKNGLEISQRHITLSTCGLVDKIYELAELKLQINLAISLHAPNDDIRLQLMPIAKKYPIETVLKACKDYGDTTKRRVTYEYALIRGVNDSHANANELGRKLRHTLAHVNLIPVNDVKEHNFIKGSKQSISEFAEILRSMGIDTTIRRELGSDINAACGQLRKSKIEE